MISAYSGDIIYGKSYSHVISCANYILLFIYSLSPLMLVVSGLPCVLVISHIVEELMSVVQLPLEPHLALN